MEKLFFKILLVIFFSCIAICRSNSQVQEIPNRDFNIQVNKIDTLFASVDYDSVADILCINDTVIITFNVDMGMAINSYGFNHGDTVVVQSGFFNTGAQNGKEKMLELILGTNYSVTDTVIAKIGNILDYQYFIVKDGIRIRENYSNFQYSGAALTEQELRQVIISGRTFSVNDEDTSLTDPRRQPQFPCQNPLMQTVKVKWLCDVRPAYRALKAGKILIDLQGSRNVLSADSIKSWGVAINGPATNLPFVFPVGDWAPWTQDIVSATSDRKMFDDGTHGDLKPDDSIYTITYTYPAGLKAGKLYKFTIGGGDVELGNSKGVGNYHLVNIPDLNSECTVYSHFGSINPYFYETFGIFPPIDSVVTSGVYNINLLPVKFLLMQNFPNPFNPSTTISYSLPKDAFISLKVYDVLGREIQTLVSEYKQAGKYEASFNAQNLASGLYFYRLESAGKSLIRKMLFLK